jgi:hypothetical protein
MKTDRFTKLLLIVIALFLGIIALRPFFEITPVHANSGQFDYLDVEAIVGPFGGAGVLFFDSRTGEIWIYGIDERSGKYEGRLKLTELGRNLTYIQ